SSSSPVRSWTAPRVGESRDIGISCDICIPVAAGVGRGECRELGCAVGWLAAQPQAPIASAPTISHVVAVRVLINVILPGQWWTAGRPRLSAVADRGHWADPGDLIGLMRCRSA